MKKRLNTILCTLVLANCGCLISSAAGLMNEASSDPSSHPSSGPPQHPYYLTGKEDVWRTFPAKPALGSSVDQGDLLITLSTQISRTDDQKKEAIYDKDYSIKLVSDVIDPDFESKYSNTFSVLRNADIDAYFITSMLKRKNGRLRPFAQHPTLVVPIFTAGDFSYPSGHASGTELQARSSENCFPRKATIC